MADKNRVLSTAERMWLNQQMHAVDEARAALSQAVHAFQAALSTVVTDRGDDPKGLYEPVADENGTVVAYREFKEQPAKPAEGKGKKGAKK